MKATRNTVVSLSYQLRNEPDGPIMDEATADTPFEFLFGHGNVLDKFEQNLDGLIPGNQFGFVLTPEEGYGEFDPEAVIKMKKSDFRFEGEDASHLIEVGNLIPLQDQFGNPFQGRITYIQDDEVTIDLNHPFAGKTLYFTGEVLNVREAHAAELEHGHIHQGGDHSHH
jgi:FKBP-type peptidyl-prolyl cis-trans isomerase SlyD